MTVEQEAIKNIFCLIPSISQAFFKPFEQRNSHPELGKSHIRTLISLKLEGSATMTQVSQRVELEKGSFTPVAQYLIERGYIERVKLPQDRRLTQLVLTPDGDRVTLELMQEHHQLVTKTVAQFTEQEKAAFFQAADTILSLVQKLK